MATDVDRLLEELLTSDEEEELLAVQASDEAHSVPSAPIEASGDAEHKPADWGAVARLPGPAGPAEVPAAIQPPASSAGPASPLPPTQLGPPEADGSAAEGPVAATVAAGELLPAPAAAAHPGDEGAAAGGPAAEPSDAGSEGGLSDVATEMSDVEEGPGEPGGVLADSVESGASALHLQQQRQPEQSQQPLQQDGAARQAAGLAELGGLLQQVPVSAASPKADLSAAPTPNVQLPAEDRLGGSLGDGEAAQPEAAGAEVEAAGQGDQQQEQAVQPLSPQGAQQQAQQQPTLLEVAEEMERRLGSDGGEQGGCAAAEVLGGAERESCRQELLVASLASQLEPRAAAGERGDGPASHLADERGTVVGRCAAARAFLSPSFESLFRGPQHGGVPSVLAKYHGMVAVGTSHGSVHVLMPAGKRDAQGQPRLVEVSERPGATAGAAGSGGDCVTSLCFGQQHAGSLLMLSGHASGVLKVWELKSHLTGGVNWSLAKTLANVHGSAVTSVVVLEGGPTTWALSADAHGRLMCHNLSRHLSVTAQALTSFARQLTGAGSIPSHLISLQPAGQDPGVLLALAPLHAPRPAGHGTTAGSDHGAAEQGSFVFVPELGHFLLLCASRALLLCLLSQEGRMQVLHVFLPPLNTPADCAPYAAWTLEHAPPPGQPPATVAATVAVAWQSSISVYRTVLLWRRPPPQGRRHAAPEPSDQQPLPPPALLNTWLLRNPVCGALFLDSGALVVVGACGETATELLVYSREQYSSSTHQLGQPGPPAAAGMQGGSGGEVGDSGQGEQGAGAAEAEGGAGVERAVVRDWVVGSQVVPIGDSTYHNACTCFGEQMLLLMSQGVRVVALMTWQQRLSALIAQRQLERALLAAVNIFHASALPPGSMRWPADGAGANPSEVSRQLLTILCGLLDAGLAALAAGKGPEEGAAPAEWLAEVGINACLLLRRPDALLSDVFPRWQHSPFLGAFLQQLEPHILRDQLPSLAPEVMQALVEHFVSLGQPERVERCVLKMDILSLDLNQLIPLCLRNRLYGALLHIFTGSMVDYQTPASLLLVAAAAQLDKEREGREVEEAASGAAPAPAAGLAAVAAGGGLEAGAGGAALLAASPGLKLGYQLLVFLQCCLLGRKYPPGSGPVPPEQAHAVKVQGVAFLLYATALSVWECWRLWGEMAHADDAKTVAELPTSIVDPHPALRLLCRMDAACTLGLLRRALRDWDAVEADLADVLPSVSSQLPPAAGDRTMTQAVIDAVVDLIESGGLSDTTGTPAAAVLRPGSAGGSSSSSGPSSSSLGGAAEPPGTAETTALQFVADHLASNRAVVPPSIVMRILAHLAPPAAQQAAQQGAQQAQQAAAWEGTFRDVYTHAAGALRDVDKQEAVWLARRAGYLQAEARIRELEGAHGEALACLVKDSRHPEAPFKFVRELLADPATPPPAKQALEGSVLQLMAPLMELNAACAAKLVLDCFPGRQQEVLSSLAPTPRLQFAFLRSLVELQRRQQAQQAAGEGGSRGRGRLEEPGGEEAGTLKATSRDPRLRTLLADMSVANLFVELLCQFDPPAVLPFLQSYDTYGVDECLRSCGRHRVQDGAAYLLERRGDVTSALRIYIQALEAANRALVDVIKGGSADAELAAFPPSASPSLPLGSPQQGGRRLAPGAGPLLGRGLLLGGAGSPVWGAHQRQQQGGAGLQALPELQAAQDALRNAISVCIRYSQDRVGASEGATLAALGFPGGDDLLGGQQAGPAADSLQRLWFQVLQGYVVIIRELRQEEQQLVSAAGGEAAWAAAWAAAAAGGQDMRRQRLQALQQIFTVLMEDVIRGMAGHVPLRAIAEAIIHQYGADQFGDFKSTLLGLLGACNFELSILQCANRVVGSDGARILASGYRQCSRPAEAPLS